MEEKPKKMSFKVATLIALAGACIVVGGTLANVAATKLAGVVIATIGLVPMGNRLYERIKEVKKEKENNAPNGDMKKQH